MLPRTTPSPRWAVQGYLTDVRPTSPANYGTVDNPFKQLQAAAPGYVQLWWSDTCKTNWARVVNNVGGNWDILIRVTTFGNNYDIQDGNDRGSTGAWVSPMVYADGSSSDARVWISPAGSSLATYFGDASQ
jgi:hypothetical protein